MKTKILFLLLLCSIIACQNEDKATGTSIEALEKAVADNPSPENKSQLAEAYYNFAKENTNQDELVADYLYKSASLYKEINRFPLAINSLTLAVRNHYNSKNTPKNVLLLADLYENGFKKPALASIIKQAAKRAFPTDEGTKAIKINATPLDSTITQMSAALINAETGRIDVAKANDFVAASELLVMTLPNKQNAASLLQKAGEVARSMRAFPKAIDLYQWIYTNYPKAKEAPQALFMQAFTFDNELQQKNKAKELYQVFLERYPEDDFADDTKFLLENLGKSNEEIIQGFGTPENN